MYRLFNEGGPLFMGLLTLILLLVFVQAVRARMKFTSGGKAKEFRAQLGYVRSLGLLGFVTGLFGQLMGLYQALSFIQEVGDVSPTMLAGGLKVSIITTLYGILILVISLLLSMVLDSSMKRNRA